LRRLFYHQERLIVIVKDLDSIAEPRQRGGLRVEDLGAEHLADLSGLNRKRGQPGVDRRFADYLAQGFQGVELGVGDIYGSDLFLLEEHRGGGAAADFLRQIEASLRDRGYRRSWGYVVSDNRPARWIYSTRKYAPMWTVTRRRVLILRRSTRESA
jgi:GNAT superfamily N-acetyltransferase